MQAPSKIASAPRGSDHIALDCTGMNFYRIDRGFQDLLKRFMDPKLRAYLEPHYDLWVNWQAESSTSLRKSPISIHQCYMRVIVSAATRIGSGIIPPIARWSGSRSANSAFVR